MSGKKSYFGKAFNDLHIQLCLEQVPNQEGFDRIRELFVNLEKLCTGDAQLVASMAKELVELRDFKRKNQNLYDDYNRLLAEHLKMISPKALLDDDN